MEVLFLGIKGHIVCLNKQTGEERWRTKLRRDWGRITNVTASGSSLFAYVGGEVFCLSQENGDILWVNKLKGLGSGSCIMAHSSQEATHQEDGQQLSAATEILEAGLDIVT